MNKKKFYIITTCCLVAILIVFQIILYCVVGEEELLKNTKLRVLWICFPTVIVILSFVRDYIIKKQSK